MVCSSVFFFFVVHYGDIGTLKVIQIRLYCYLNITTAKRIMNHYYSISSSSSPPSLLFFYSFLLRVNHNK